MHALLSTSMITKCNKEKSGRRTKSKLKKEKRKSQIAHSFVVQWLTCV